MQVWIYEPKSKEFLVVSRKEWDYGVFNFIETREANEEEYVFFNTRMYTINHRPFYCGCLYELECKAEYPFFIHFYHGDGNKVRFLNYRSTCLYSFEVVKNGYINIINDHIDDLEKYLEEAESFRLRAINSVEE